MHTPPLQLPSTQLRIPVEIPDEDRTLFGNLSGPSTLIGQRAIDLGLSGLQISDEELFAYAMFYEWADEPGWRTYADLRKRLPDRRKMFDDYVSTGEGQLVAHRHLTRDMTERIGVGASLSVAARLLDLTNADFDRIPETSHRKTLDYSYTLTASDGERQFQVEAKGVRDGLHRSRAIEDIRAKKGPEPPDAARTIALGVVCDLTYQRARTPTRLFVVDPEGDTEARDPKYMQLLRRLRYYRDELSRITWGRLATALANRIAMLERLEGGWRQLSGVPLVDPYGKRIRLYETFADPLSLGRHRAHGRMYDLRLLAGNLDALTIEQVKELPQRIYFRGLHREVLLTLIGQKFDEIAKLRFDQGTFRPTGSHQDGAVDLLPSGLVVGILQDQGWDRRRLPREWGALKGIQPRLLEEDED